MAGLKRIKQRIRSVSGTRQITKAMQMVAASKLRKAELAARGPQAYTVAARQFLAGLVGQPETLNHPFFVKRSVGKVLDIVIAGDRGLAGPYNGNIEKALARHLDTYGVDHLAICIGRHAAGQVARMSNVDELAAYDMGGGEADIALAKPILEEAMNLYLSGEVDRVHLLYTRYTSTVKQSVSVEKLLPIEAIEGSASEATLEPGAEALIGFATSRLLEAQLLDAILSSRASEEAARMMAMMNATDNAEDLIEDLTLTYNNERQASITNELAEISAGAEAIHETR